MVYQLVQRLGEGSFGLVELVEDETGKRWARKTFKVPSFLSLPRDQAIVDQCLRRFRKEVSYQSQIDHPNVAKIISSDLEANPPYYIMEVADGTLEDELRADNTLGGQPTQVLFDVLAGLQALHDKGIWHRDLKPSNILKYHTPDGTSYYALSDFGLAAASNSNSTTLTASGDGGGTERYAPPEFVQSLHKATAQSDIYSFGALLHDIFSDGKRVPYTELDVADPKINPIVSKCTKRQPLRRYNSVVALREELFEALSGPITFHSTEEQAVIEKLQSGIELSDDDWDEIYELIESNYEKGVSNDQIFRIISLEQLQDLSSKAPELFAALGEIYCQHITELRYHNFDYCDVIADKLQVFYDHGNLAIKSRAALTTLWLGTSHNRWYVERKFVRMAGPEIQDNVAQRIAMEIRASSISEFSRRIEHLKGSIPVDNNFLHPIIDIVDIA